MSMRSMVIKAVAVCALASQIGDAQAEVKTFARAGGWSAFGGTSDNNKLVCGVSTQGGGRWFGIKYFQNNSHMTVQLSKDSWKVTDGTKINLQMQFDRVSPWTVTATAFHMSDGDAALEFQIPRSKLDQWLGEFRAGSALYVRFPNSSVEDWRANLSGTSEIADKMGACLAAMNRTLQ